MAQHTMQSLTHAAGATVNSVRCHAILRLLVLVELPVIMLENMAKTVCFMSLPFTDHCHNSAPAFHCACQQIAFYFVHAIH